MGKFYFRKNKPTKREKILSCIKYIILKENSIYFENIYLLSEKIYK